MTDEAEILFALIRALAMDNVPLRTIAKDSGVIATDDFASPIGVYADCGRLGDVVLEAAGGLVAAVLLEPERESGQHDRTHLQILDEKIQLRMIEPGVLGFEDEVVVAVRAQQFSDGVSPNSTFQYVSQLLPEIRAPFPEVVVHIDHRHAGIPGAASQLRQLLRGGRRHRSRRGG